MSRTWIIIGSIVLLILLALGGVWWYLLMNGRPESLDDVGNPFSTGGSNEFAAQPTAEELAEAPRVFDTTLRKITDAAVAGAVFIERNGTTYIRYAERGTGHIFEVDAATGGGERISNTTIPRTTDAIWSPQGLRAVFISETATGNVRIFANTLERDDEGEIAFSGIELDARAENIAFAPTGETVYYTIPTETGSTGYAHDLLTEERTVRFSSELRDIAVIWEPALVVYTRASAELPGFVYEGADMVRHTGGVPGLLAMTTADHMVLSYAEEGILRSRVDTLDGTTLAVPVIPEKCVADTNAANIVWCGAPTALAEGRYPDVWYQGIVSFNDIVWQLDLETGSATLVSIPSEDVGEAIDVMHPQVNEAGDMLTFINKKDGSLWLQEIE